LARAILKMASPEPTPKAPTAEALFSSQLPVIDQASRCLGGYAEAVSSLRATLNQALSTSGLDDGVRLRVTMFGHGGRDTTCWLAAVQAVAGDVRLRERVLVELYSCSWPDDDWEFAMTAFLERLKATGSVPSACASFTVMKYHEEHSKFMERMTGCLQGAHVVIQCEQGVDFFVEPVTGEWLQDNYEDWAVAEACVAYAESTGALSLLVQTNSDLDLYRGIDADDLNANVFAGQLQTEAFSTSLGNWGQGPLTGIGLAVMLGNAPSKKAACRALLNFDPANFASLSDLYPSFMAFSASQSDAPISVAGVLELMAALTRMDHNLPWKGAAGTLPVPQWMVARLLLPNEVPQGHLRVIAQFRYAGLHTASTYAEFYGRLMCARRGRRRHANSYSQSSRYLAGTWGQLNLGKQVAEAVRAKVPDFDLWKHGDDFLVRALCRGPERNIAGVRDALTRKARAVQGPDFTEVSPCWVWNGGNIIHILDFACRLLESPDAPAELEEMKTRLPPCAEPWAGQLGQCSARFLEEALVEEWRAAVAAGR